MADVLKVSGPLKVGSLASAPSNPSDGYIYFDTTGGTFQLYQGGSFREIDAQALEAHLNGGANKHDATEVDYERVDGSKKNIDAASDDVESALTDLDDAIGALAATPTNYTPVDATIVASHLAAIDSALTTAGGTEFADDTFRIKDNATPSKKIAFQASGISASTVRTVTMPDADVDLGNLTNSNISTSAAIALSKLSALTANRATVTDGSGVVSVSTVTDTEIGYVSGVTSSIQTQLNAKALDSAVIKKDGSVAFTGNQAMGGNKLTGLAAPTANGDALRFDQLGANSGIATLDSGGKVPVSQLPASVMTFEGTWDASTNSPSLADSTGSPGMVYLVSVAGSQNLGSGSQTFAIGDWVVANSSVVWEKTSNSNAVVSVNSQTGVVTVNAINQLTGDVTTSAASGSESKATTIASGAVTAGKLGSVTDGTSLNQSGAGSTIQLMDNGVTSAKLASSSVIASKLGSVSDGIMIDQNGTGSKLQLIDASITNAKISASAAIAYSKLNLGSSIVNADVASGAAIAYSKLNLGSSIVNADVSASAAIDYSKLNLGTSIVNGDISASAAIAYSKLNLGSSIVNADVSASAAIAYSKLNLGSSIVNADIATGAAIAATKIHDGSVSNTEFGYLDGVTSGIQGQINAKLSSVSQDSTPTLGGNLDLGTNVVIHDSVGMRRGSSSSNFLVEDYIHSVTLAASQTNSVISEFNFAHATYEGFEAVFKIKEGTSNDVRIGTIRCVTNGTDVAINEVSTETADVGISFSAVVNGANINIRYTSGSNACTMRADVKLIKA